MTINDPRAQLVRLMRATLADRRNWTYLAVRPMPVPPFWQSGQHVVADCSKAVQYLCRWAQTVDPMGNRYDVWGNSSTIALHLAHLPNPGQLFPGDIVTFGPGGSQHAAMVLEPGFDPLLWSHGHQGAPNTYRLSKDRRVKQYLRLPVPGSPPPIPADVAALRAATGFWSWLKWKQGEGEWKLFGPENPGVRPNVSRNIGLSHPKWWLDRERFLAARKPNPPKGLE